MSTNPNVQQFGRVSLREQVSKALRAAIVSGELKPGVVYSAPALGARFNVSATPVREAMLDLIRENLVITVPNKGFRVTPMNEADLDEITQLRMLIEPPLAAQIAPIPAEDMPTLRHLAQAIIAGALDGDLVAYTAADRAFHLRLLEYNGNRRISALVADLRDHTRLYGLASLYERGELEASAREHDAILDAFERGDPDEIERFMADHIAQTRGRWARPANLPDARS